MGDNAKKVMKFFYKIMDEMEKRNCHVSLAEVMDTLKMIQAVKDEIKSEGDLKSIIRSGVAKTPECAVAFDEVWKEIKEELPEFFRDKD